MLCNLLIYKVVRSPWGGGSERLLDKKGIFVPEVKYSVFEKAIQEWFPNGLLV
jgi:hypothetical protein